MSNDIFPLKSQVDQGDPAPSSPSGHPLYSSPDDGLRGAAHVPIAPAHEPQDVICGCGDVLIPNGGAKCGNCIAGDTSRTHLLIQALDEYVELLGAEVMELARFAFTHDWKSSRVEQGDALRERIAQLRVSDRNGKPAAQSARICSEERDPKGDAQENPQ